MSEIIGYTQCPFKNCKSAAEFKKDKRQKKFINCPTHGRIPGSTNEAQAELESLLIAGAVFDSPEDFHEFSDKIEQNQHVKNQTETQKKPEAQAENAPEDKPEKPRKTGLIILGLGIITGGIAWAVNQNKNHQ